MRSPACTPWPTILHPQWAQVGASTWIAHSKESKVPDPRPGISIVMAASYSLPQWSQVAMSAAYPSGAPPYPPSYDDCMAISDEDVRLVTERRMDLDAAEDAARSLLVALGFDLTEASLQETPRRIANALGEFLAPETFVATTFPNDREYDELVIVRDVPFHSLCEHHLLPFKGVAHVGYLPGERIVGLSKLARVVEHFARNLQVQERLTKEIADWLDTTLQPRGVGVVLEAEHLCMTLRGVRKPGSMTVTSTLTGTLREDARTRQEFLDLVHSR